MRRSGTLGCSLNVGPGPAARREQIQQFTLDTCTSVAVELRRLFRKWQTAEKSSPFKDEISRNSLGSLISLRSRLFLPLTEENGAVVRPGATAPFTNSGAVSLGVLPFLNVRTCQGSPHALPTNAIFPQRAALHGAMLPRECAAGRTRSVRRAHGAEPAIARPSP